MDDSKNTSRFITAAKGFTLVELLVVISIISLLSSVIFASLNSARAKARDAKRLADLNQIYLALQQYFDANGYLPTNASYGEVDPGGWDYSSQGQFLPFLQTGGFFSKVPVDPLNNGTGDVFYGGSGYSYAYHCYTSENSLALGARLEKSGAGLPGFESGNSVLWKANHEKDFKCQ